MNVSVLIFRFSAVETDFSSVRNEQVSLQVFFPQYMRKVIGFMPLDVTGESHPLRDLLVVLLSKQNNVLTNHFVDKVEPSDDHHLSFFM